MKIKLNLIPPYKKAEIKQSMRLRSVLRWEIEISAIFLIFFGLIYCTEYISKINLSAYVVKKQNINSGQMAEFNKYELKIKDINARFSEIDKIQKGQFYWTNFFNKFNTDVTDGIEIENLASRNYSIIVVGKAATRENLIAFRDGLQKNGCFSNVTLPLSYLVSKTDIVFQMDFILKNDCLKK